MNNRNPKEPAILSIDATQGAIDVYDASGKSLPVHREHLDRLAQWVKQISKIESELPNHKFIPAFKDFKKILELNAVLNIATLDLAVIIRHFYISKDEWEHLFYAKQGCVIVIETINAYDRFNQKLNYLVNTKLEPMLEKFNNVMIQLKSFKHEYQTTMNSIRNKTAAHIDHFVSYYDIIKTMDVMYVLKGLLSFMEILNDLQRITTKLVDTYDAEFKANR